MGKAHLEFVNYCTKTPYLYVKNSVSLSETLKRFLVKLDPNHMKNEPLLAYDLRNLVEVMFVQNVEF